MISRRDTFLVSVALVGFVFAGFIITGKLSAQPEPERPRLSKEDYRAALLEEYDLSNPQIDTTKLLAPGRIGRDGIPALTDPTLNSVADAAFPADDARVIQVVIDDEAVAYPLGVLNFHEIVNATVGGTPIAVTYCPLCDSVAVFDRRLKAADGTTTTLEFGVSGFLFNSNVVMYERTTMGLWSQVFMQAVTGPHATQSLDHLPVNVVSFADFKREFPDGKVLSEETGHKRPYDRNPYEGYFTSSRIFHEFDYDDRLPPKELGLGIRAGKTVVFVTAAAAREMPVTVDTNLGPITVTADDSGVQVQRLPDGAMVLQTFYHSWAAFYPGSDIVPTPQPKPESETAQETQSTHE